MKPEKFLGEGNLLQKVDSDFENVCILIESEGINTKGLNVFEFYSRKRFLEKKYQKK